MMEVHLQLSHSSRNPLPQRHPYAWKGVICLFLFVKIYVGKSVKIQCNSSHVSQQVDKIVFLKLPPLNSNREELRYLLIRYHYKIVRFILGLVQLVVVQQVLSKIAAQFILCGVERFYSCIVQRVGFFKPQPILST